MVTEQILWRCVCGRGLGVVLLLSQFSDERLQLFSFSPSLFIASPLLWLGAGGRRSAILYALEGVKLVIQWNPSYQDTLKCGHLNKQDTFCCPKCHVCVQ